VQRKIEYLLQITPHNLSNTNKYGSSKNGTHGKLTMNDIQTKHEFTSQKLTNRLQIILESINHTLGFKIDQQESSELAGIGPKLLEQRETISACKLHALKNMLDCRRRLHMLAG